MNDDELTLYSEPGPRTSILLEPFEGEHLRSMIIRDTNMGFNTYLQQVGLHGSNVYNYLTGKNAISLQVLTKLLAASNLKIQCQLQVMITSGKHAQDADSMQLEEMLLSADMDTLNEVSTTIPEPMNPYHIQGSCSSEKLQDNKKTIQDYHFKENPVES